MMPTEDKPQRSKPLALVADDSEDTRDMYVLALVFSGFDAITAADGPEALRLASERLPDVIVLDMGMPRVDGWEVCRRIRAAQATSKTPIIAVTGHALMEAEVAARVAGCDVYLTKPLLPERLVDEVWRVLSR